MQADLYGRGERNEGLLLPRRSSSSSGGGGRDVPSGAPPGEGGRLPLVLLTRAAVGLFCLTETPSVVLFFFDGVTKDKAILVFTVYVVLFIVPIYIIYTRMCASSHIVDIINMRLFCRNTSSIDESPNLVIYAYIIIISLIYVFVTIIIRTIKFLYFKKSEP